MRNVSLLPLLFLLVGCGEATVTVPALHGSDIILLESECHKIRPIGWAMMIERDMSKNPRTIDLFEAECKRQPKLRKEVEGLLETYWMIQARSHSTKR